MLQELENLDVCKEVLEESYRQGVLDAGGPAVVIIACRNLIENDPKNTRAAYMLCVCCSNFGDSESSVGVAEKAIEANPDDVWGYLALAESFLAADRKGEAKKVVPKIQNRANDYKSWMGLAAVYSSLKMYEETAKAMEKGLEYEWGRETDDLFALAELYRHLHQWGKVQETVERVRDYLKVEGMKGDEIESFIAGMTIEFRWEERPEEGSPGLNL